MGKNFARNRFGRNVQVVPADLDLSAVCTALVSNGVINDAELHPDVSRLLRLCNGLNKITGEIDLDGSMENQDGRREWTGPLLREPRTRPRSEIVHLWIRPADSRARCRISTRTRSAPACRTDFIRLDRTAFGFETTAVSRYQRGFVLKADLNLLHQIENDYSPVAIL